MNKIYFFLLKLFPIKIIFNRIKIVKIRNISDKTFLPIEEEILIHCGEIIGIVKHGRNNEHVNSHLDLFVYKVEKIEGFHHVHCNFDNSDRILVVNQDYLKYIRFY